MRPLTSWRLVIKFQCHHQKGSQEIKKENRKKRGVGSCSASPQSKKLQKTPSHEKNRKDWIRMWQERGEEGEMEKTSSEPDGMYSRGGGGRGGDGQLLGRVEGDRGPGSWMWLAVVEGCVGTLVSRERRRWVGLYYCWSSWLWAPTCVDTDKRKDCRLFNNDYKIIRFIWFYISDPTRSKAPLQLPWRSYMARSNRE